MGSRSTQLQRASTLHTRKTRPCLAQVQTVVSDLSSPVQMRENDTVPELTEGGWNGEFVFSEYADVICKGKVFRAGLTQSPGKDQTRKTRCCSRTSFGSTQEDHHASVSGTQFTANK
jgi:hypothetical protein